ncbi:MAG: DnaJ family domain-containing protein [Desulfopila sp.]
MDCLAFIAEQKIAQAIQNGELQPSGWQNRPLVFEDDHLVPEDLRIAYKILKNSGYLPPELATRKEITRLEQLIASTEDEHQRLQQMRKLAVLMMKVEAGRNRPANIGHNDDYYQKVVERTSIGPKTTK